MPAHPTVSLLIAPHVILFNQRTDLNLIWDRSARQVSSTIGAIVEWSKIRLLLLSSFFWHPSRFFTAKMCTTTETGTIQHMITVDISKKCMMRISSLPGLLATPSKMNLEKWGRENPPHMLNFIPLHSNTWMFPTLKSSDSSPHFTLWERQNLLAYEPWSVGPLLSHSTLILVCAWKN